MNFDDGYWITNVYRQECALDRTQGPLQAVYFLCITVHVSAEHPPVTPAQPTSLGRSINAAVLSGTLTTWNAWTEQPEPNADPELTVAFDGSVVQCEPQSGSPLWFWSGRKAERTVAVCHER